MPGNSPGDVLHHVGGSQAERWGGDHGGDAALTKFGRWMVCRRDRRWSLDPEPVLTSTSACSFAEFSQQSTESLLLRLKAQEVSSRYDNTAQQQGGAEEDRHRGQFALRYLAGRVELAHREREHGNHEQV